MKWVLTRIVFPIAFIVLGIIVMVTLVALKPSADRSEPELRVAQVQASPAEFRQWPTEVRSTGTVTADQEVNLIPEVSGRIVWVADGLLPGARVDRGATLARVDSRPYEYVVRQRRASLRQAELELQLERERAQIATREWAMLDKEGEATQLALRKPQLETVELAYDSAKAQLEAAELDLARTSIRAPFNAVVINESLDVGQVVNANSAVASLVGSDRVRVSVSVPVQTLAWLRVGDGAEISQRLGNSSSHRQGSVLSTGGQLDAATRTATVIVGVDDPLSGEIPLMPGAFVSVAVRGMQQRAVRVPREALSDGEEVWLANSENTLEARNVSIGWGDEQYVYVVDGLEPGERVIRQGLVNPLAGLPVEVTDGGGAATVNAASAQ